MFLSMHLLSVQFCCQVTCLQVCTTFTTTGSSHCVGDDGGGSLLLPPSPSNHSYHPHHPSKHHPHHPHHILTSRSHHRQSNSSHHGSSNHPKSKWFHHQCWSNPVLQRGSRLFRGSQTLPPFLRGPKIWTTACQQQDSLER